MAGLRGPRRCAVFLWASLFVAAACVVLRAASRLYGPPPPNPFAPIDIISLFAETWLPAQLPAFALGLLVYRASRAQDRGQAIGFLAIGSFAFVVSALPGQAWLAPVAGLAMAVWGASRANAYLFA